MYKYLEEDVECAENSYAKSDAFTGGNSNKIRDIKIKEVDHGYVVRVGCKKFVFETSESLIKKLCAYIRDPHFVENLYNDGSLFNSNDQ